MDDGGTTSPATSQVPKEISLTVAASSMINAADRIDIEAYQANLRRIHDVKDMVQRLEMNNESAHKNYLVDQLEKRAKEGREAEDMLARLKSQPGLSETVRITNNVPSENSEVVLPTTATLVEVPESHSSTSTPTATLPLPVTPQSHPATYQWRYPEPIQPHNVDNSRYYRPPQSTAVPASQVPVNPGLTAWYSNSRPGHPQPGVHSPLARQAGFQPAQVQQSSQSWSSFPHQVVTLPASMPAPGPAYNSPVAWTRTTPGHGGLSSDSSSLPSHVQGIPASSVTSQTPTAAYTLPQNLPTLIPASRLPVPLQGAPGVPVMPPSRPPPIQPHPERAAFQSPSVSQTVIIPELQQSHKRPQRPQQHRQQSQSELHAPLSPRSRLHSHQLQAQPQFHILPRPPLPPEQRLQRSQVQPPTQCPPHSLLTQQVPSQSADRAPSDGISQPQNKPSPPTNVQQQAPQRGSQLPADQETFNKCFQYAVERGGVYLRYFWFRAKASGISDEWFKAAIASVPRNVWESVVAQINQSGPTLNAMPVVNPAFPKPPSTTAPVVQTTPISQEAGGPSNSAEAATSHSAARQISGPYAAQLQYYADQATRSTFVQAANIPIQPVVNVTSMPPALTTPQRDVPQTQANTRTPKDANKSTLARDILHSLGKIVPEFRRKIGGEPVESANDHGGDQPSEVTLLQPVTSAASPKSPAIPPATSIDVASSLPILAGNSAMEEPRRAVSLGTSGARPGVIEKHRQTGAINGPIMIDLTLDNSDKSEDEKTPEPTFLMQTSGGVADTSSRPACTNTTNLLENLTLEEPLVDVTADTDNVDVRMSSPPFSLPAEESMESELVYPPANGVVPVSRSFELIPREISACPSDGQLPLFLPSPPASPVHEPPETDLEMIDDEVGRPSRKRRSVDIEEVKLDTGLVTPPRSRKRRKRQVYVLVPPAPPYVKRARMRKRTVAEGMESHLEDVGQDEEPQYSHLEQLLIEESKSRLLERRCRWLNCDALLNCATNLLAHLKKHAREEELQAPFACRWASCQWHFDNEQERDVHLERHTIRPLPCPLAGCDKQFDKPVDVMQHEVQHQRADYRESLMLKPTCQPIVPAIPARLGPPPHQLPSHRVIPRRVVKCRISADRHATLGPWILWNIFSPVDLNMRKQNASMRGRSTRQAINHGVDSLDRLDDYDFLLALSSYPAKHPPLDDLDSTLITASAARGLTLWGSGPTLNSGAGPATPEEHTDLDVPPVSLVVDAAAGEGEWDNSEAEQDAGAPMAEEELSGRTMGEEDTVKTILTV